MNRLIQSIGWPYLFFRRSVGCLLPAALVLVGLCSQSAAQSMAPPLSSLPPLRIPRLAAGSRCFGLLPCTDIDPFGIRLRLATLAVFRPEREYNSQLYAARIHIAPSVTLFRWAEVGVVLPITLYKKDVGVSPVYEPIQPFGRLRIPLEDLLGGIETTLTVAVHIASGPFVGGLPPAPTQDSSQPAQMPNLMLPAAQGYTESTRYAFAMAFTKRVGALTATGSIGTLVGEQYAEVYGGVELAYHWNILHPYLQAQGVGVPRCSAQEANLNLCERGFRFGAGVRFDWDIGAGGLMVGTGSGASEPGWMVGAQLGLDYDEKVRQMHGLGEEAVQAWWDRHLAAWAKGWAEWKAAAAVWPEDQVPQHVGPYRPGPFSGVLPGPPPPSSPWTDALLNDDDDGENEGPEPAGVPGPQTPAGTSEPPAAKNGPSAAKPTNKPKHSAKRASAHPHSYAGVRQAIAAGARSTVPPPVNGFQIHGADGLMSDQELAWEQWREEKLRLLQEEEQKRRDASKLPPFEKVALNWFATAPARAVLGLLAMSGPGRRPEAEEMMRKLRPLKCTPEEEEGCDAGEQMFDMIATTLVPAGVETALARQAALALVRDGAWAAAHPGEFAAAERQILKTAAAEGAGAAEPSGGRFVSVLDRLPPRLNPANYECAGLGCNFGNIRYRNPQSSVPQPTVASTALSETSDGSAINGLELTEETKETLITEAMSPSAKGVSPVGRALQKHAARPGSAFSSASGNAEANTTQGGAYLRAILDDPASQVTRSTHKVFGEVIKVRLPDGSGAWFKADGEFIGFLERYTPKPD